MKLRLQITTAGGSSFSIEHQGPSLRVGRDPDGELALEGEASQSVSWNHARIEQLASGVFLSDLKSTNGTFLNDKRVNNQEPLKVGDLIQLGYTGPKLKVVELDLAEAARPQRQPASYDTSAAAAARGQAPAAVALQETAAALPTQPWPGSPGAVQPLAASATAGIYRNLLIGVCVAGVGLGALVGVVLLKGNRGGSDTTTETQLTSHKLPDTTLVNTGDHPAPVKPADQATFATNNPPAVKPARPGIAKPAGETPLPDTGGPDAPNLERKEVAHYSATDKGWPSVLLQRQSDLYSWGLLPSGSRVTSADYLMTLPGYRSNLTLESGVQMELWGNIPEFSPTPPILECTLMLHVPPPSFDADFTLDHGRVHLANYKMEKKEAKVRVRFHQEIWEVAIPPGPNEVVLELWGMFPPEGTFNKEADGKAPLPILGVFVKGQARLETAKQEYNLSNQSRFTWAITSSTPYGPDTLPKLPDWWVNKIDPDKSEQVTLAMQGLLDYRDFIKKTDSVLGLVSTKVKESSDPTTRALGVLFLGAMDAIPPLLEALEDRNFPQVRNTAAHALRQWMCRNRAQDLELYRLLEERYKSKEKAEIIMQLLHPISAADFASAPIYQKLLGYLEHDNLAIRELAFWHLAFRVPNAAQKIKYDAMGPEKERKEAVAKWKQAIPPGTVPPQPQRPAGSSG